MTSLYDLTGNEEGELNIKKNFGKLNPQQIDFPTISLV